MKRAILIAMLVFGVIASSYNKGRKHEVPPVRMVELNSSLQELECSLDSLNRALDEKSN